MAQSLRILIAAVAVLALPLLGSCAPVAAHASVQSSVGPDSPAYPLKVAADGHHLVDQNGRYVFWSGDAAWSLIAEASDDDLETYLDDRQAKGVGVILVNLVEHKLASNAPRDRNGDAPFTGAPFTTPNEAYFKHADDVVSRAAAKGIAVLLVPFYVGYQCGDEGWCSEIKQLSLDDARAWGTYVGNRYKNFDNVVWVIGGDDDPTATAGIQDKLSAFTDALHKADDRHVMTAHNARGQMAVDAWPAASWLSLNSTYTNYENTYQQARSAYSLNPPEPFFQIEGVYENEHSTTAQQLRAQAYWTVLSGGMGYVFGSCPLWGLGARPVVAFCTKVGGDWRAQLDSPGAASMVHVRDLFVSRAWQDLVPDWDHVVLTGGYGSFGAPNYVTAARSTDGSLMIAYLPNGGNVDVDLSQFDGPVAAQWYDPADGAYVGIGDAPMQNSGSSQFVAPSNNAGGDHDWVLVLERPAS
jgi:hypothetical protein